MVSAVTIGKRETELWHVADQSIALDRYPAEAPSLTAVMLHGPWESAGSLASIGLALQALGVQCVCLELPGCGRSAAMPAYEFDAWVQIALALVQRVRAETAGKVALLGIGCGGTLAYFAAAAGAPIDVLVATAFGDARRKSMRQRIFGATWPPSLTTLGMRWLSPVLGERPWLPPGVIGRELCNDMAIQTRLDAEPLPQHSIAFLSSLLNAAPAVEPEAFHARPTLLIAPTADRWLQLEPSLDFYRRIAGDKQLHMLAGSGHLPIDEPSAEALARALVELVGLPMSPAQS